MTSSPTAMQNVEDIYGLTPMQQLMLVHAAARPDADVLANRVGYEIRGDLRADLFRRAWDSLVARHAALRTAVVWKGLERPVQVVRERVRLPFEDVDLAALPAGEQQQRIDELWREEARRPFELGRAPLMRCSLLRLGPGHHVFLWTVHHLVVDRWSHGILLAELAELYRALLEGRSPVLRAAPRFRDYVAWVRQQDDAEAERFWRGQLAGFRRPTLVSSGSPARPGAEGGTLQRSLSDEATAALEARATSWRTPPGSVVLAGVALAVARRTGADDVVFGATVSGRPPELEGVEESVGSFVSNLPVRARLTRAAPVSEWVRGLARDQLARLPFEHVSLASIADWTELPAAQPLFDLLVVVNLDEVGGAAAWPIDLRPVRTVLDSAYPLTLGVARSDGPLQLVLSHRPGDEAAARAVLDGVVVALEWLAAAEPGTTLESVTPPPAQEPEVPAGDALPATSAEAAPPRPAQGFRAPARAERGLGDVLLSIWREVLGQHDLGPDDDFFAAGGTSLQAARIFTRLERETGRTIPLSTLVQATTVRALLSALDGGDQAAGPLIALRSGGAGPPVFAVPGVGGHVVGLTPLARELGPDRPFFALESRGLDGAEDPLRSVEAIAADFVEAMSASPAARYHLVGACWGAAVAFEMARQLIERGRPPLSLALLDPAVLLRRSGGSPAPPFLGFVLRRARLFGQELRRADWTERGRLLRRKATVAGRLLRDRGIPEQTRTAVSRESVRAANVHAIERYHPPVIGARARLFLTGDRALDGPRDPRLEWRSLLRPEPTVRHVPGFDSGDAINANVDHFASALREWLDEVEAYPQRSAGAPRPG